MNYYQVCKIWHLKEWNSLKPNQSKMDCLLEIVAFNSKSAHSKLFFSQNLLNLKH